MGKRALTFLFYLHSSITNPQSFVLPDTTGSTFVCRGLVNTNEDALQTYSSELCLCSLLRRVRTITGRPQAVPPGSGFPSGHTASLSHWFAAPGVDTVDFPRLEAPAAGRRAGPPGACVPTCVTSLR